MQTSIRGRGPWHEEPTLDDPFRTLAAAILLQGIRDARNPSVVGVYLWLANGASGLLGALNIDKADVLNAVDRARDQRRARSQPGSRKAEGAPP